MRLISNIKIITGIFIVICPVSLWGGEIDDPAMKFYLDKTDSVLNKSSLFNKDIEYSVSTTSIYQNISYRGVAGESDTASFLIKYRQGNFIGSEVVDSAVMEDNIFPPAVQFEKPWGHNCRFYFFPRDTGAGDLAIGFEPADSVDKKCPEGLIILDRDTYQIKQIYLHYQAVDEYEWLSLEYQFMYENEITSLKSLAIQGCYFGFFQRRFFRQDLRFDNYRFQ